MKTHAASQILLSLLLIVQVSRISCAKADETVTTASERETGTETGAETETERAKSSRYVEEIGKEDGTNSLIPQNMEDSVIQNERIFELILNSSKHFQAEFSSVKEMAADLDSWVAPEEMRKKYPYYFAGRDDEGRSIWVAELGRWDLRSVVEEGGEALKTFDKYTRLMPYNAVKSFLKRESWEDVDRDLVFICDFDQLSIRQVGHLPTVTFFLQLMKSYEPILLRITHAGYIVNTNYLAERIMELLRPILGAVFERLEVWGANSAKWIPRLLRRLPKDQLPSWYGGPKDFRPLAVYG